MSRIALVRHGATDWSGRRCCGRTDLPLSDLGRAQVRRLSAELVDAGFSFVAIRSSPALRALEKADSIARAFRVPLEIDARLREVDFGLAEGLSFDEVSRAWPEVAAVLLGGDLSVDWPGAKALPRC